MHPADGGRAPLPTDLRSSRSLSPLPMGDSMGGDGGARLSAVLSAGPTPSTVTLTVSELASTLMAPPQGTMPGPGGRGTITLQE